MECHSCEPYTRQPCILFSYFVKSQCAHPLAFACGEAKGFRGFIPGTKRQRVQRSFPSQLRLIGIYVCACTASVSRDCESGTHSATHSREKRRLELVQRALQGARSLIIVRTAAAVVLLQSQAKSARVRICCGEHLCDGQRAMIALCAAAPSRSSCKLSHFYRASSLLSGSHASFSFLLSACSFFSFFFFSSVFASDRVLNVLSIH